MGAGGAFQAHHQTVAPRSLFASRIVVSAANASQNEARIACVRVNIQAPCLPRGVVSVAP